MMGKELRPRGYRTFFMLNSVLCSAELSMKNVFVTSGQGILIFTVNMVDNCEPIKQTAKTQIRQCRQYSNEILYKKPLWRNRKNKK